MPIIKTKKVKKILENIKQEQLDDRLTNIERLEDWEERFVEQTEQLHQIEEDLENKTKEAENYNNALFLQCKKSIEEKMDLEKRIKALEEKNESEEISLLKEIHQKEISEIEERHKFDILVYGNSLESAIESNKRVKELEKELEEKELLIEELEVRIKEEEETSSCHLYSLELARQWRVRQSKEKDDNLEKASKQINKQRQELLDKIKSLESEVEWLTKQQTQQTAQIEVKEVKKQHFWQRLKK